MRFIFEFVPLLALALHVHAHGVLTTVTGANGVAGQGFGVIASTPRTGTTRNPFQQDTSIIRDKEVTKGDAGVCGRTLAGGNNDVATQLDAAVSAGLPSASEDGSVSMTLHQVNGDGAGPYTCDVSTDATGSTFTAMTVTTNVPGKNSRSNAKATDFVLVAQMPAGTTCTGGANGDACLVRCRNAANAGPFGGCVAVTNAGSANGTATSDTTGTSGLNSTVVAASAAASVVSADSLSTAVQAAEASETVSPATAAANSASSGVGSSTKSKGNTAASRLGSISSRFAKVSRTEETDTDDDSIHDAELALAADLERRIEQRLKRSRIVGGRALYIE